MSDVYLPADHSDEDLDMAATVARGMREGALFVTWSLDGRYFEAEPAGPPADAD